MHTLKQIMDAWHGLPYVMTICSTHEWNTYTVTVTIRDDAKIHPDQPYPTTTYTVKSTSLTL